MMENKNVGYLLLGVAVVLVAIIFIFKGALEQIVAEGCTQGPSCPMFGTITQQTYLALGIVAIIMIVGFVLIFSKPKEKIIVKKILEKKKKIDLSGLDSKEREVIDILEKENGTVFQATLMEKLNIGKVGITRLLDKLEAKQIIERKRRGMNNVVVLKD